MNEMGSPEKQFRSWRLRQPTARLKRRIFSNAESSTLALRWFFGALTPTAACLLLTLALLNPGNDGFRSQTMMTLVLSNQSHVFSESGNAQTAENRVDNVTFDWTNHSVFNSSIRFTPTTNLSN